MNEQDPSIKKEKEITGRDESQLSKEGAKTVIGADEFKATLIESRNPTTTLGRFMAEATAYRTSLIEDGRSA